jgi:Fic family protein
MLQLESKAHIEVQQILEEGIESNVTPFSNICSAEFLSLIHKEFYHRMPDEYLFVKGAEDRSDKVIPGSIRSRDVIVGKHIPPPPESLKNFLNRFQLVYAPDKHLSQDKLIAGAAAHHRLTWIHPFLDGNGRVARLFSHAYHASCKLGGTSLWSISRGFGRAKSDYLSFLAGADEERRNDLDGRGCLSDQGLRAFCNYFLDTALDQVRFMKSLLDIDGLTNRLNRFVDFETAHGRLQKESAYILREVCLRGSVPRGDALRVTGLPERSARRVLTELLKRNLLVSDTPKGHIRIRFSLAETALLFPRLYPDDVESKILSL